MKTNIYIDLGSSSTKVYVKDKSLHLESIKSLKLKDGFTPEKGITSCTGQNRFCSP